MTNIESALLGLIILHPEHFPECVSATDFREEKHRNIFAALLLLRGRREPINRVMVANELLMMGKLEASGGITYLVRLDDALADPLNVSE